MNNHKKLLFTVAGTMGLVVLAAGQTAAYGQTGTERAATIQLHVVPNGANYKLKKTGRLVCNTSRPEGCINVPKGDTASISFALAQMSGWRLTKITICKQDGNNPCKLSGPQRADFEFTRDGTGTPVTPDNNGEVDLTTLDEDLQEFVMFDGNIVQQGYEYTIEACDESECTVADPPLENGGRN